jgi:hypothetical protein
MDGVGIKALCAKNPVFMRLRSTLPIVTMRLCPRQSQEENTYFPQFSWVFVPEMPIFTGFCGI